ncbi:NAD-dependent epimerase/dehydratase family protein [Sulfurospirillum arcachonense]|uniref:NAD-dependent epimerase/dehydratase family protein n=1 Tax=Sulfurospirillum arcachonense TaxID=57666 RepID=UPI00046ACB29|nr:NAD-dependent epimerase/dehydratase family protein [Sulfurospirillum arcachonense]
MKYENFENSKVLVVGGAGFVGANLVKNILNETKNVLVVVVDNLMSSEKENLPNDFRLQFLKGSIVDDEILKHIDDSFDFIFHLATFHGNQSSIFDPLKDHENNTLTTLKLMNHIKDYKNLKKLVYSAAGCSCAEKTFDKACATDEEAPISLVQDSPYSMSKIFGEFYSVYFFRQHGLPTVRARFQNVYGPGEVLGAGEWRGTYATVWRNVTPTFIYKAINNEKIPLENEGIATRDFIFVDDICKGLMLCALNGTEGDVYNLGSGQETTIAELAEKIKLYSKSTSEIEYLPKRNWDNSGKRFASIIKSKQELGFKAVINIDDGLKTTIHWTKNNIDLINENIQKHSSHMDKI